MSDRPCGMQARAAMIWCMARAGTGPLERVSQAWPRSHRDKYYDAHSVDNVSLPGMSSVTCEGQAAKRCVPSQS